MQGGWRQGIFPPPFSNSPTMDHFGQHTQESSTSQKVKKLSIWDHLVEANRTFRENPTWDDEMDLQMKLRCLEWERQGKFGYHTKQDLYVESSTLAPQCFSLHTTTPREKEDLLDVQIDLEQSESPKIQPYIDPYLVDSITTPCIQVIKDIEVELKVENTKDTHETPLQHGAPKKDVPTSIPPKRPETSRNPKACLNKIPFKWNFTCKARYQSSFQPLMTFKGRKFAWDLNVD